MGRAGLLIYAAVAIISGCQPQSMVSQETTALTLGSESVSHREIAMRRFDTKDETTVLSASAGVLQDLGFTIDEANAGSGFVVGSKNRDAVEAGQVAGQVFLVALAAAAGVKVQPVWDKTQKIRVSIVTQPSADKAAIVVRVTFQRIVWNTRNQVSHAETIADASIDQQFFDKLSQAVFLEAHQV